MGSIVFTPVDPVRAAHSAQSQIESIQRALAELISMNAGWREEITRLIAAIESWKAQERMWKEWEAELAEAAAKAAK
jgi:hypothetical protein